MQCAITLTDPLLAYANKDSGVTDSLVKVSMNSPVLLIVVVYIKMIQTK